jgi:sulfur-oxidizing protein SoxZ
MTRALVNVPAQAKKGDVIEIKTLIAHPMESGYRVGYGGETLPRDIIWTFSCDYDGARVFLARFSPAVAANPFVAFHTIATASGTFVFRWEGDNGFAAEETAEIVVE